jgi:hypothetical protein
LKNLQGRIAELEAKPPSPEYKGTFTQGSAYGRGALVSRQGGLWLALADTIATPGHDPAAWRLIVNSGGAER